MPRLVRWILAQSDSIFPAKGKGRNSPRRFAYDAGTGSSSGGRWRLGGREALCGDCSLGYRRSLRSSGPNGRRGVGIGRRGRRARLRRLDS